MPRKTSGKTVVQVFGEKLDRLDEYIDEIERSGLGDQAKTWAYEAALLKLYVAFEKLMLRYLVTCINNDSATTISARTGIPFPKHLPDPVCEYLIIGDGYFNFRGFDGLIDVLGRYLPKKPDHWLIKTVKDAKVKDVVDQLVALRNYAAHESEKSKASAKKAAKQSHMTTAGSWLKVSKGRRFKRMTTDLRALAAALEERAPY